MSQLLTVILASWGAGLAAFIGGLCSRIEGSPESRVKREMVHGIVAFGGGILIAAVAFALAPAALVVLSPVTISATFISGGIAFCFLDSFLSRKSGPRAQFMAMLMDFVPEAISLGAVFGHNHSLGVLLAAFIGAQNLPEGFNAYREILAAGGRRRGALRALFAISFLGPIAAATGYFFLCNQPKLTAGIMSFAAGGILYLIFQDIAPQSKMRFHWTPPLGAVIGFVVGMVGKQLIG